jgi:large subunit ribosomal protein L25
MSDDKLTLAVMARDVLGKQVRQLRRDGMVPGVIYDHGKKSIHIMSPYVETYKAYLAAGGNHPITLSVGDKKYLAMIRDADFEPKKHLLRHVVFNAIKQNQKVHADVPVHLTGDIPAEISGLMVIKQLDLVEVDALPKNLPNSFELDATGLAEVGDHLTVADLQVPEGVVILTDPSTPVVHIEESRAQMSAEEEESAESNAEGEVPSDHGTPTAEDKGSAAADSGEENTNA